ncbi:glycerophosphoryl diester phosphodiesterase membrane domain-containing protein [Streptomyces sp. NRRL WC-3549]|uniref:glycerophosphoryl diester phosphodiesterase membrane domain-containing protein n=1 Tax=Streptomyces sp. NRRL WC-3549 TaxID=1463925 RepID=UPI0004CBED54|nr:glycerophosphoryl diester phosphodiesterase membrane domain-containing protein [Streptomyces sp. NRRL WC-3549]
MNDSPGWASPGSAPSDGQDGAGIPRPSAPADASGPAGQWSATQPQGGQWSPPSPPGGGPGMPPPASGRGGAPGPGWGGRPPMAAKPGVIPLRPLGVLEILDGAVSTMRTHWRPVLGISLTISVITEVITVLLQRYVLPEPTSVDPNAVGSEALRQASDSMQSELLSTAPTTVIGMIATLFATSVLTVVVSRSVLGRGVTLGEAWSEARPRILPLLGLTLLLSLMSAAIVTVGLLPGLLLDGGPGLALAVLGFFGAVVVVLWLMIRFTLAAPALMLERQPVLTSLRRSAKLVRGSWWRIFGILALTYLMVIVVTLVITIPFGVIAVTVDSEGLGDLLKGASPDFGWPFLIVTGIGGVIVSTLAYPFTAGVMALLYIDRRIRREALDLDLARAAGVPGYDTPRS